MHSERGLRVRFPFYQTVGIHRCFFFADRLAEVIKRNISSNILVLLWLCKYFNMRIEPSIYNYTFQYCILANARSNGNSPPQALTSAMLLFTAHRRSWTASRADAISPTQPPSISSLELCGSSYYHSEAGPRPVNRIDMHLPELLAQYRRQR